MPSDPQIDLAVLESKLVERADGLLTYIGRKTSASVRRQISPDDILQEVWLSAFQHLATFRAHDSDSLDRWLTTLTDRALINAIRKCKALKRGGDWRQATNVSGTLVGLWHWATSSQKTPSREASGAEIEQAIRNGLSELSDRYAQVLRLRYFEGCSVQELSDQMQISRSAGHSLLYHARRELCVAMGSPRAYFSDAPDSDGGEACDN